MTTRRDNIVEDFHGTLVADPYRWLEGQDPEVEAWVEQQNQQTEEFLAATEQRQKLEKRLMELWDHPRYSVPLKTGSWYFFEQNSGLQNQPILYRQQGLTGEPQVVLDPNLWSSDGTTAISNYSVSASERYLAYTISAHGSDRQEIRVRDLETQENLHEVIRWCRFTNLAWVGDQGFYYSRYPQPGTVAKEDETNYNQVYWHKLGTEQEEDLLVYECPGEKELSFSASVSSDERYLLLHVHRGTDSRNGFYYRSLEEEGDFVRLFEQGQAKYHFLGNEGARFYFYTDQDAPKGRIVYIDVNQSGQADLREVLPEQADVISQVRFIGGKLIVSFMHNAHSLLRIYSSAGKLEKEVELPGLGSIEGITGRQRHQEFFIGFTSFLDPLLVLHYDLETHKMITFSKGQANFARDDFETKQVFYPSKDGTKVSMFLVHKKGLELTGNNPVLLYGYGGFNIPITPSFNASRILWLEHGGVYAVANLRGGSEYGEEWHQMGMLENKQNVFDDFISAGEWLIANGYTRGEKLAIEGRSNGGLLVAACMVQRPELFGAVICGVPVTDMLRYHKFTVGRYWISEYGNGEANPEHFAFLYRYSPLHNVKPANYPPTLVVTADGDDRVVPAHAYKFTAALQAAQRGEAPILIRVDTKSGHGHGKPVAKIVAEHADVYGFLTTFFGL